jgi:hypothetical protein
VCYVYWIFYWILEHFRQCGIFCIVSVEHVLPPKNAQWCTYIHNKIQSNLFFSQNQSHKVRLKSENTPKNAMFQMGFDPGTSRIVSHPSTNWAKEISTNAVSRGGYEFTTVLLAMVLFVLRRFTDFYYPFGIFKLFLD